MKKVLFVFAIAAAFAACNNTAETPTTTTEDSIRMADSIKALTPIMDTTAAMMDTTSKMMADTSKMMADTTKK